MPGGVSSIGVGRSPGSGGLVDGNRPLRVGRDRCRPLRWKRVRRLGHTAHRRREIPGWARYERQLTDPIRVADEFRHGPTLCLAQRFQQLIAEILNDRLHVLCGQSGLFLGAAVKKQPAADLVDLARQSATVMVYCDDGRPVNGRVALPVRVGETVLEIGLGLGETHRLQSTACNDALLELGQAWRTHDDLELLVSEKEEL